MTPNLHDEEQTEAALTEANNRFNRWCLVMLLVLIMVAVKLLWL